MKRKGGFFLSFLLAGVLLVPADTWAKPYYEKKVIKLVVGFATGGGYDRLARLFARHLPKHIPGKPSIIIQNMPGASSMVAANTLYNIDKPDGFTIATLDRGLPYAQMLKAEGIRFDLKKFAWIGSGAVESTLLVLRSDFPQKTFSELLKSQATIHLAALGPASSDYQFPTFLKEFTGANVKIAIYPSTQEGMLAVERKEVDGKAGSFSALKPFIDRGLVRPVVRCRVSLPGIENLPVNEDFAKNNTGKTLMALLAAGDQIGRPFVAPPNTPEQVMKILRAAFAQASVDQELQKEARKLQLDVKYVPEPESRKVLHYVLDQPDNIVKEFGRYVKF